MHTNSYGHIENSAVSAFASFAAKYNILLTMAGFSDAPIVQSIAVPAVCLLIAFLAYGSQLIFHAAILEPGPPSSSETWIFNGLLLLLWYTYLKTVVVDPGRYVFADKVIEADGVARWCKKCEAPKPPRAHHCRLCGRCVPRMDHHCPWTRNCVSMTTFPHFLRFLFYANISLWTLGRLLWQRFHALYDSRNMPAYLGPSMTAMISLTMLSLVWSITTLVLLIMLVTTVRSWILNQTMIEGWEIDRHEAIADRSGRDWWDIVGPGGKKIRFEKIEFPYDIGFFANMAQAMGTANVLMWFFPFAGSPKVGEHGKGPGWTWPENGFNRETGMWPPPDPDKIRRAARDLPAARHSYEQELREMELDPEERKRAFKERQERDLKRRRLLVAELEEVDDYDMVDDKDVHDGAEPPAERGFDGAKGWTNSDGDRLRDYGVDEEAEGGTIDDAEQDDDVPLGELLRRRKVLRKVDDQDS